MRFEAVRIGGPDTRDVHEEELQPSDNVRNGLLDSFHGKTIGIGTRSSSISCENIHIACVMLDCAT